MQPLVNPRRACARVTVLSRVCVCLSVCLSVPALAALAYVCMCNQRYARVSRKRILTRGFLKKPSVQKLWREKANMQMS